MRNASRWCSCRSGSGWPSRSSLTYLARRRALTYVLGGWKPPLGVALRADGLSAVMLVTTALVIGATALFARADFTTPRGLTEARAPLVFWTLLLAVWAAMNAVFLGHDLFNLYVALELLTFGAVPLVCLDGRSRDPLRRAALSAVRARWLGALSARHGAALWSLWHAGHHSVVRENPPRACRLDRGRADDGGTAGQDRAVPPASVAAARPCRRAGRSQRGSVGARGQGILFPHRPHLVRRHAGPAQRSGGASARHAWRGSHHIRKRAGASAGPAEASDRLLDRGADRLSVPDVSAHGRHRRERALAQRRLDRRLAAADLARLRQGLHVHGSRPDRRGARP